MYCKLFQNDCLKVLKSIPGESIDLVVTDPPYKCISGGKPHLKTQPSGILSKNDGKIFEYNDIDIENWLPEIYRVLKSNTYLYIMVNVLNIEHYLTTLKKNNFNIHNILVWEKNNCTPNRWYMKNCEYIIFARKGKAKRINEVGSKTVHKVDNIIGNKQHPSEKPVELMQIYVLNSSQKDDVVLDPFMGSGSTGVACLNSDRNFIGIEIDAKYFNTAKARIIEANNKKGNDGHKNIY